jgi:hypothetical protein
LSVNGYIQHHLNDANVDAHLLARMNSERIKTKRSLKWNGEHWAYWRITKPGFRSALRIWGIPTGTKFRNHLEKTPLLNSPHRRRSRQWPSWVQRALPHAEIYAGWNEVGIPELRSRPDGLAWGKIDQAETLFWLEVETTKARDRIEQTTALRWAKAKGYAKAVGVRLVFVVMGMPWIQNVAQEVFTDIPPNCAVIITGWHRLDFGKLPYPKWGELVAARYPTSRKHFTFIT